MANVQVPVCGVQMDVMIGDNETNVQRMVAWLGDERTRSARLVVFPSAPLPVIASKVNRKPCSLLRNSQAQYSFIAECSPRASQVHRLWNARTPRR